MKEANWYKTLEDGKVECFLCPRKCLIADGRTGFCGVRKNTGGKLFSLSYGYPQALQIDPIEKKPLSHFMSGTKTFSFGTFGCNLACVFCQNHHLSRAVYREKQPYQYFPPEQIVELTLKHNCASLAFTYNEPTVFAEYAIDVAKLAKEKNLATVLVSNGYITMEAAKDFYPLIDAANIDMKGFSEEFYTSMTSAHLQPVLDAIKYLHTLGKHVELTNLVIPGKNDSMEMLDAFLDWAEKEINRDLPIHFSAYHPDYKYDESPRTPPVTLYALRDRALKRGFTRIHLGNVW
ncbi:MAG: AmmeMemoRadiSam system radical SAM enzyme [Lentisphaerae bacterium GWF2_44_16]|nr:MAG: AmmeMemoRadiSam system radical SAM enzyme [Lentisphaerae bacterium GWF2_44_16]